VALLLHQEKKAEPLGSLNKIGSLEIFGRKAQVPGDMAYLLELQLWLPASAADTATQTRDHISAIRHRVGRNTPFLHVFH